MKGDESLLRFRDGLSEIRTTVNEALLPHATFSESSRNSLVELAALRAASLFEELTSSILELSLLGDPFVPSNGAKLAARNEEDLRILLHTQGASSRPWVSLSTVRELLTTADNYLHPGHVFDRLRYRADDRRAIDEMRIVRNAVAHPSDPAGKELQELAQRKRYHVTRPADYLLSKAAGIEEIRLILARVLAIGIALTVPDVGEANSYLQTERNLSGTEKAPVGDYKCATCGTWRNNVTFSPLGSCANCLPSPPCPNCGKTARKDTQWRRIYD